MDWSVIWGSLSVWLIPLVCFVAGYVVKHLFGTTVKLEFDEALLASADMGEEIDKFFTLIKLKFDDGELTPAEYEELKEGAIQLIAKGEILTDEWWDFVNALYRKFLGEDEES